MRSNKYKLQNHSFHYNFLESHLLLHELLTCGTVYQIM